MALVQNNNARYPSPQPDFDAVQLNEHWIPPGATKRSIRGMKAANGGDISQLGAERLTLDHRLQLFIPTTSVAYFQPGAFDLDVTGAVAARVAVTLDPITPWTRDNVTAVQEGLVPKEDLSEAEVEGIIQGVIDSTRDEVEIHSQIVSAFINTGAEGNNALRGVILSVANDAVDLDTRTVAAGATNEEVPAISGHDVERLSIEHLTTLAEHASRGDPALIKSLNYLTGLAYASISTKFAAAFEPFSTAVEQARVSRVTDVNDALIDHAINYDGILGTAREDGDLRTMVRITLVMANNIRPDLLNELTDQDFTAGEIAALTLANTGDEAHEDLAAARLKQAAAGAAEDSDWIATVNDASDDEADVNMYGLVGVWEAFAATAGDEDYLIAVAKYALAAPTTRVIKIRNTSSEALCDFAATRMNTINHELSGQCTEVHNYLGEIWGAISLPKSLDLFDAVSNDIVGQVQHATAHISYMKSGHHATANNLGHTFTRLLDAIDHPYDVSEIPQRLAFGTYYGTKPADQRAVALFLRAKYSRNELSFAIGRRITPHGPGTVSMFLLNMVIQQLNEVDFFQFMGREDAYAHFKGMYASYAKTSYLEVPYANFFYGASKAESVDLKQAVGPMFAYAAAIGAAMPHSSIGDSVSLKREASAAASNSITAKLEVESFVKAYRTFLRTLIREKMSKKAKLSGGTAMLEDGED